MGSVISSIVAYFQLNFGSYAASQGYPSTTVTLPLNVSLDLGSVRGTQHDLAVIDTVLRSRPTCHGIRRTVIDTARESSIFRFFCIILRLDPCQTGLLQRS